MSGLSSPASLITVNAQSTPINIYSIAKIGVGLTGLLAPAFAASTNLPFKYSARGINRPANTTANADLVQSSSLGVRLTAARDIVLGLLMRDTTAAVVVRALQADILASILDTAAAASGYIEGSLSKETATGVAGFALSFAAFGLYILQGQHRAQGQEASPFSFFPAVDLEDGVLLKPYEDGTKPGGIRAWNEAHERLMERFYKGRPRDDFEEKVIKPFEERTQAELVLGILADYARDREETDKTFHQHRKLMPEHIRKPDFSTTSPIPNKDFFRLFSVSTTNGRGKLPFAKGPRAVIEENLLVRHSALLCFAVNLICLIENRPVYMHHVGSIRADMTRENITLTAA
ncbi:hypothetical protein JCM8547_004449 [Rhodosporidiobolus lusitaniae]